MANDPHNQSGYMALIGSMVFTIAFMAYITFLHPGVDLDNNEAPKQEQAAE